MLRMLTWLDIDKQGQALRRSTPARRHRLSLFKSICTSLSFPFLLPYMFPICSPHPYLIPHSSVPSTSARPLSSIIKP